jgi:hypothetical protein
VIDLAVLSLPAGPFFFPLIHRKCAAASRGRGGWAAAVELLQEEAW